MNLFTALVFVVFSLSSKAENYHEYSTFVTDEEFEQQFFSDELEDTNYTSGVGDVSEPRHYPGTAEDTTVDATRISFLQPDNSEVDSSRRNTNVRVDDSQNFESDFDHSAHRMTSPQREDEMSSEKLLGHFSPMLQGVYKNYEESFQNKNAEFNQAPMRREINAWRDEFSNMDTVPWSLDAFYPRHGSPNSRNDYFDDASYAIEPIEHKNHSSTEPPLNIRELIERDEQPYYQKNYYYNYYPPVNSQKLGAPLPGGSDEHDSVEVANSGAKKFIRKNPCKQYLQFLKYAFEKLDENADYNYDYSEDAEDWRAKAGPKNPKVFAVHLLGPTLYVDNSGKVSQINAKGNSYQTFDRMPHAPKTPPEIPITPSSKANSYPSSERSRTGAMPWHHEDLRSQSTTMPPYLPVSSTRSERLTTQATESFFEQSRTTTEQPWLMFSLKTNLTSSNTTKEPKFYPDVQHRSSFGSRMEEEWKQHVRDEGYETTVRTKTEQMMFDEYDYGETKPTHPPVNSYPPMWFPSEEYYRKLAKALERKENDTKSNAIASETNAAVGPPVYMFGRTSTPQTTTFSPMFTKALHYDSTEVPRYSVEKKDDDCNDKMLPCPDTVNVTYPLNGYCNRYVSCESGRAIRKTCPDGLHFNVVTKSCDLPHNSFCSYTCPSATGHYGIPGDCNGFFACKNHVPEYRMCPPRMHWDINKSACTFAELSSCPMKCSKPNEVVPYEGDCKAYIICLNGIPYYHKCPPNAKFDRDAQSCVPHHQSRCEDDPRLLTKTSNPNHLCRNVEVKLGTKVWCNHFFPDDGYSSRKQYEN